MRSSAQVVFVCVTHLDCVCTELRASLLLHLANVWVNEIVGATHGLWRDARGWTETGTVVGDGPARSNTVLQSGIRWLLLRWDNLIRI